MEIVKEEAREIKLTELQEILDYLQTKPYCEVHQLIHKIIVISQKE